MRKISINRSLGQIRCLLMIGLLLGFLLPGLAQNKSSNLERTAQIDAFIQAEMERSHIPGLALAIVKQGEILYAKGYGFANLEHQVPVKVDTVFQSGSTGKQYTAMAVLMLAEAGKLKLEDSIRSHFPDAPESWQGIAIRHLLTHTSGLGDYTEKVDMRQDMSEEELRKLVFRQKIATAPGEKFAYSNLGYVTLGLLVSKVSGMFYGDYLAENVFKPLGMNTARIINESAIIPNRSAGYFWDGKQFLNQEWVSPIFNSTADGSLYLTLADVAKWDGALSGGKLISPESLKMAWTSGKLNNGKETGYGFGWFLTQMNSHRLIEHGGAWQGFMAMISRYVDDQLTVIMFANVIMAPVEKLTHEVAGIWNPELKPPVITPIENKEPAMTAVFKTRLEELSGGKSKADYFTAEFAKEIFPEGAEQMKGFLGSLGAISKMELMKRSDKDGLAIYSYRVQWGDMTLRVQFQMNPEKLIAGFGIRPGE